MARQQKDQYGNSDKKKRKKTILVTKTLEAAQTKKGHYKSTLRDRKENWKEKAKWNNNLELKRITGDRFSRWQGE